MKKIICLLLILGVRPLLASDCSDDQESFSAYTNELESMRSRASSSFVECAINGPNNEKYQAINDGLQKFKEEFKPLKLKDACFKTKTNLSVFLSSTAEQMGHISAMAMIACSEEAQNILNDPKLSERKKKKQIQKMILGKESN